MSQRNRRCKWCKDVVKKPVKIDKRVNGIRQLTYFCTTTHAEYQQAHDNNLREKQFELFARQNAHM